MKQNGQNNEYDNRIDKDLISPDRNSLNYSNNNDLYEDPHHHGILASEFNPENGGLSPR